jgi:alpha-tubulin suppressor-like RCC1 family protein
MRDDDDIHYISLFGQPTLFIDERQGLLPGATYQYKIGAFSPNGVVFSDPLSVTLPAQCPRPEFQGGLSFGVLLLRYPDAPGPLPYTRQGAYNAVFNSPYSIANYMTEISRGSVALTGDVSDWLTMPHTLAQDCQNMTSNGFGYNCSADLNAMRNVARSAGFPVDSFERVLYVTQGVVGRNQATTDGALLVGQVGFSNGTVIHEVLGHSFGLIHAGAWTCPGGGPGPSLVNLGAGGCSLDEYGDYFDPMGGSTLPFGARNLFLLGLLRPEERQTVVLNQTYELGALGSSAHPLKELSVPLLKNNAYSVEYRAATGFENAVACSDCSPTILAPNAGIPRNGVQVRLWSTARPYDPASGRMLDANTYSLTPAPLQVGQKLVDKYRGVTLRVLADSGQSATVALLGPGNCSNGIKDGDETAADCGGSCAPCASGKTCFDKDDCSSAFCPAGACVDSCTDHVLDNLESDVDCGGNCPACTTGQVCRTNADCASNSCQGGICFRPGKQPISLDTGEGFTCAVLDDGLVRCWGRNDHGQLGIVTQGSIGDKPGEMANLQPVALAGRASLVVAGTSHACALLESGVVQCWGNNVQGQLGVGDTSNHIGAVTPDFGGAVDFLTLGDDFGCVVTRFDGKVKCWGVNYVGQLGIGNVQTIGDGGGEMGVALSPVALPGLVTQIQAGEAHVCAVLLNDAFAWEVRCWGYDGSGQLGFGGTFGAAFGDSPSEKTPPAIALGDGFQPIHLALGGNHSCALSQTNNVKCWGSSMFGECGYGDTLDRGRNANSMGNNLPLVPLGFRVLGIDSGGGMTCAWGNGGVKCWGMGSYGLGQPGLLAWDSIGDDPQEVPQLPFIQLGGNVRGSSLLSTSGSHVCAELLGGDVKCWGLNESGQLGLGDTAIRGDDVTDMGSALPVVRLP